MRYVFGNYSLDTQCYELRRAGELIPLGPQVFNVLAYLVAQRDRVVSHDELFARLWPDQFVTDDALGRCIRAARRALEDRPEAPRYITTTRGRGYRFIAPVQEQPHAPPEDGALLTVPAPSIPQPLSAAGSEEPRPPVSRPTVSGDHPRHSEEYRLPSLAGEYKQVTVLCGGLADALALAGRLGPEAMHRRMQSVFTAVQQVMHRYAGSLIELSGEGFVALFGAPVAQEDHAQRAVLAALALHAQVGTSAPDTGPGPGEPLALCLGLHTGRVVVACLGSDPPRLYTAAGETTQVALRLRQLAAPGTILLSAATQRLVQEDVWVAPQGEVTLSAAHAPVPVYGVRGMAQQRSGVVGYGARARSPFVGRAREVALLHERLDAVVAGQGQVVAVVGEPGMGKSRLLAEYRRSLVGRAVRYVEGHCLSYGSATPYLPLVDLVRQLCATTSGAPYEAITATVHRRLQQAALDPDEGVPLVLSLLDIPLATERLAPLSPPERKARTFALLRHLVLHEAQRHPCILAVENLHWSDATSEEWLTSLVERLAGVALLVLVTYRPGYQPSWLAQSYATQIALSRLRAGDSRTVVQAVLQAASVPETVIQEIVTHAAGNPFFLEELTWNVVEHGEQPPPLAVPETIEAVLAARIDRLPPEAKRLLQTAAVVGMQVPTPLLQAVTEISEAEILTHLSHLQTAEFLYETGGLPELAYTFKHALTQEVAYESLLQERRRVLHARIVKILERLSPDRLAEQVERLAYHALRGEVWEKVLRYAHQAGTRAADHSAYGQAGAFFDQALDALVHLPESQETMGQAFDLHYARASMHGALRELERLLAYGEKMWSLAETLGDPHRLAWAVDLMGNFLSQMGDNVRALEFVQRGLALAETVGAVGLLVSTHLNLGMLCRVMGDYRRGVTVLAQTVELLRGDLVRERFGRPNYPAVTARLHLTTCLAALGEFRQALSTAEEGSQIAEALQQPSSLLTAHVIRCEPLLHQGQFHDAVPRLERALALCTPELIASYPMTAGALGFAYAMTGRLADALKLLEQAVERARRVDRRRETQWLAYMSEAYLRVGRQDDAHAIAEQTLALARAHQERGNEAHALRLLGDITARHEPPDGAQAAAHYCQALALAEELGMRPLQAHCHLGLGTLHATTGQREQAHAELSTAIALYRTMEMTFWLPQAEAALAQVEAR